jgi:hypothetical protein
MFGGARKKKMNYILLERKKLAWFRNISYPVSTSSAKNNYVKK